MKQNSLVVALNFNGLSVSEKILRSRQIMESIADNPTVFTNPLPSIAAVMADIDELETAQANALDGGKSKTILMHDKEALLMKTMYDVAHYVQSVANGNPEIVHLATLSTKKPSQKNIPDFAVTHGGKGSVKVRVKPNRNAMLRIEYCQDPMGTNAFVTAKITKKALSTIDELEEGTKYWFRVVYIQDGGEKIPYEPLSIIVI